MFLLLAWTVTLVAVHNQYQDSGTPKDNIHIELVYALYGFIIIATGAMYSCVKKMNPKLAAIF